MEGIVRTMYRQLYKKAARMDNSVAMRSLLRCMPHQVYDHHIGEWVPFDVTRKVAWPEPNVFLDNLIRRLNSGREFYLPPIPPCSVHSHPNSEKHTSVPTAGESDAERGVSPNDASPVKPLATDEDVRLLPVLRRAFEETPFTTGQLNNAFAALKELAYATDVADRHFPSAVSPPALAATMPMPSFTVSPAVAEVHQFSIHKGLTEALDRSAPDDLRWAPPQPAHAAASGDAKQEPSQTQEEQTETQSKEEQQPTEGGESFVSWRRKALFRTPPTAQLLLAHPQLGDFFQNTVLLVARATSNQSVAFILNKPLENEEGMLMPVSATVRLNDVHPIFGKHLGSHPVMIGGPVTGASFDTNMVLLHRVPDVEDAVPLSRSLWVDGSLDALQQRLEEGTAHARDILVLCGFSGWGCDQLHGEVRAGTWVVAQCPTSDTALDDFLFAIPQHAAMGSATGVENRRRAMAAWVWAFHALGAPFAELAKNQKPNQKSGREE